MKKTIIKVDHRNIECSYFRVQADSKGRHRVQVNSLRDAGANLDGYAPSIGNSIRRDFNKSGTSLFLESVFQTLIVGGVQ